MTLGTPIYNKRIFKVITLSVLISFTFNCVIPPQFASAQTAPVLPAQQLITLTDAYSPVVMKGLKLYPDNPLKFDFILDKGEAFAPNDPARPTAEQESQLKEEATRLIKYFLASLTTPEKDMWVNLNPKEPDRIVPQKFGETEMGRDLLAQDYLLKQMTASLMHPDGDVGKKFWSKIYQQAYEKFGTTDVPVDTLNKVWIVPEKAVVYENQNTAFVVQAKLKVMLEEDYEALEQTKDHRQETIDQPSAEKKSRVSGLSSMVIRQIILPVLEKEVNEGKNFAQLRQVYHSLILATWFKRNLKESLLGRKYVDQSKTPGVNIEDKNEKFKIYDRYLEAFKKGAYNYIKEEYDPATQAIVPKKYFSGGITALNLDSAMTVTHNQSLAKTLLTALLITVGVNLFVGCETQPNYNQRHSKTTHQVRQKPVRINHTIPQAQPVATDSVVSEFLWSQPTADSLNLYEQKFRSQNPNFANQSLDQQVVSFVEFIKSPTGLGVSYSMALTRTEELAQQGGNLDSVVATKQAVCLGFTRLIYFLGKKLGLPNQIYSVEGQKHVINVFSLLRKTEDGQSQDGYALIVDASTNKSGGFIRTDVFKFDEKYGKNGDAYALRPGQQLPMDNYNFNAAGNVRYEIIKPFEPGAYNLTEALARVHKDQENVQQIFSEASKCFENRQYPEAIAKYQAAIPLVEALRSRLVEKSWLFSSIIKNFQEVVRSLDEMRENASTNISAAEHNQQNAGYAQNSSQSQNTMSITLESEQDKQDFQEISVKKQEIVALINTGVRFAENGKYRESAGYFSKAIGISRSLEQLGLAKKYPDMLGPLRQTAERNLEQVKNLGGLSQYTPSSQTFRDAARYAQRNIQNPQDIDAAMMTKWVSAVAFAGALAFMNMQPATAQNVNLAGVMGSQIATSAVARQAVSPAELDTLFVGLSKGDLAAYSKLMNLAGTKNPSVISGLLNQASRGSIDAIGILGHHATSISGIKEGLKNVNPQPLLDADPEGSKRTVDALYTLALYDNAKALFVLVHLATQKVNTLAAEALKQLSFQEGQGIMAQEAIKNIDLKPLIEKASYGDKKAIEMLRLFAETGIVPAARSAIKNLNVQFFIDKSSQGSDENLDFLISLADAGNLAAQEALKIMDPHVFVEKVSPNNPGSIYSLEQLALNQNQIALSAINLFARQGYKEATTSLQLIVGSINELHGSADSIRFAIVNNSSPVDLYTMIVSAQDEVLAFPSTFTGLFNRMMEGMKAQGISISGDGILNQANYYKFRTFFKLAVNFNRLNDFLGTLPSEEEKTALLEKFVKGLDKEKDVLAQATVVADVFGMIKTDATLFPLMRQMVKTEFERTLQDGSNRYAEVIYGLLTILFAQNTDINDSLFKRVADDFQFPDVSVLHQADLFDANGIFRQVQYFYEDEDGDASFKNLLNTYKNKPNWKIIDFFNYILIKGTLKGRTIEIYANKPFLDSADQTTNAQNELDNFIQREGLGVYMAIHRGHSYHVQKTIDRLGSSLKFVFLGSCGGSNRMNDVLKKSPGAQILATKGIGTATINDLLLKMINDLLLSGQDVNWHAFRSNLAKKEEFKRAAEFIHYIFPDENTGFLFIRAYMELLKRFGLEYPIEGIDFNKLNRDHFNKVARYVENEIKYNQEQGPVIVWTQEPDSAQKKNSNVPAASNQISNSDYQAIVALINSNSLDYSSNPVLNPNDPTRLSVVINVISDLALNHPDAQVRYKALNMWRYLSEKYPNNAPLQSPQLQNAGGIQGGDHAMMASRLKTVLKMSSLVLMSSLPMCFNFQGKIATSSAVFNPPPAVLMEENRLAAAIKSADMGTLHYSQQITDAHTSWLMSKKDTSGRPYVSIWKEKSDGILSDYKAGRMSADSAAEAQRQLMDQISKKVKSWMGHNTTTVGLDKAIVKNTIAKSKFSQVGLNSIAILERLLKNDILENVSSTEVRLKSNNDLSRDAVLKIVGQNNIDQVWSILLQSFEAGDCLTHTENAFAIVHGDLGYPIQFVHVTQEQDGHPTEHFVPLLTTLDGRNVYLEFTSPSVSPRFVLEKAYTFTPTSEGIVGMLKDPNREGLSRYAKITIISTQRFIASRYFLIGQAEYLAGLNEENQMHFVNAESNFKQSIATDPTFAEAHYYLGLVQKNSFRYEAAIRSLTKAINLDPTNANYYRERGSAYDRLWQHEKALRDLNKALQINPNDKEAIKLSDEIESRNNKKQSFQYNIDTLKALARRGSSTATALLAGEIDWNNYGIPAALALAGINFDQVARESQRSSSPTYEVGNARETVNDYLQGPDAAMMARGDSLTKKEAASILKKITAAYRAGDRLENETLGEYLNRILQTREFYRYVAAHPLSTRIQSFLKEPKKSLKEAGWGLTMSLVKATMPVDDPTIVYILRDNAQLFLSQVKSNIFMWYAFLALSVNNGKAKLKKLPNKKNEIPNGKDADRAMMTRGFRNLFVPFAFVAAATAPVLLNPSITSAEEMQKSGSTLNEDAILANDGIPIGIKAMEELKGAFNATSPDYTTISVLNSPQNYNKVLRILIMQVMRKHQPNSPQWQRAFDIVRYMSGQDSLAIGLALSKVLSSENTTNAGASVQTPRALSLEDQKVADVIKDLALRFKSSASTVDDFTALVMSWKDKGDSLKLFMSARRKEMDSLRKDIDAGKPEAQEAARDIALKIRLKTIAEFFHDVDVVGIEEAMLFGAATCHTLAEMNYILLRAVGFKEDEVSFVALRSGVLHYFHWFCMVRFQDQNKAFITDAAFGKTTPMFTVQDAYDISSDGGLILKSDRTNIPMEVQTYPNMMPLRLEDFINEGGDVYTGREFITIDGKYKFDIAIKYFTRAIEANPHSAEAYMWRAKAYLGLAGNDRDLQMKARTDLLKTIEINYRLIPRVRDLLSPYVWNWTAFLFVGHDSSFPSDSVKDIDSSLAQGELAMNVGDNLKAVGFFQSVLKNVAELKQSNPQLTDEQRVLLNGLANEALAHVEWMKRYHISISSDGKMMFHPQKPVKVKGKKSSDGAMITKALHLTEGQEITIPYQGKTVKLIPVRISDYDIVVAKGKVLATPGAFKLWIEGKGIIENSIFTFQEKADAILIESFKINTSNYQDTGDGIGRAIMDVIVAIGKRVEVDQSANYGLLRLLSFYQADNRKVTFDGKEFQDIHWFEDYGPIRIVMSDGRTAKFVISSDGKHFEFQTGDGSQVSLSMLEVLNQDGYVRIPGITTPFQVYLSKKIDKIIISAPTDAAMSTRTTDVGGIDLNPENLSIESKGEKIKFDAKKFENMEIDGLTPVIFNMVPLAPAQVEMLLGFKDGEQGKV
ncbi:MAG: tetratricopeptide repeat protein [Candidatus Omnitrophica bacterium]|nr:tetratricopeptide repeat protein [Candidatus Omnitrophota bacterium]